MSAVQHLARRRFHLAAAVRALALGIALAATTPAVATPPFTIEILSSAPDQVSGADPLVRVNFPDVDVPAGSALLLNGVDVTSALAVAPEGGALVGVVSGFVDGNNLLQFKPKPKSNVVLASLAVRNYPQSGPIF